MVGLGAAGVAVTKMMLEAGITHIIGADRKGALSTEREDYVSGEMNSTKRWYAEVSNPENIHGQPDDVIEGMDLFIGLSGPGIIQADSLAKMNDDAMVFAMANPTPEVMPEEAAPHVRIMATGRSDYPNQINNVLAFPGIFRGALDAGAPQITEAMKLAAARGIAETVSDDDLAEDYIIPSVFNRDVAPKVAEAVIEEAKRDGIARLNDETGTFATGGDELMRRFSSPAPAAGSAKHSAEELLRRGRRGRRPHPRPGQSHRRAAAGDLARLGADAGTPDRGRLRGRRRGRQPGRREDQPALVRRGQAQDHGLAQSRDPQPGRDDRGAGDEAEGAGEPVGGRLLRRPRRRGAGRVEHPRRELRRERLRRVGEGRPRGRPDRRAPGDRPHRPGDGDRGRHPRRAPPPLQAGPRWAARGRQAVGPLDPPLRRGRDPDLGARQRSR